MQAITTRYHGPGNVRGSRISATTASGKRVYHECDDAVHVDRQHRDAAIKLCKLLDWHGTMVEGGLTSGGERVFCFIHPDDCFEVK